MVYIAATDNKTCHNDQGEQVACKSQERSSRRSSRSTDRLVGRVVREGFGALGRSVSG